MANNFRNPLFRSLLRARKPFALLVLALALTWANHSVGAVNERPPFTLCVFDMKVTPNEKLGIFQEARNFAYVQGLSLVEREIPVGVWEKQVLKTIRFATQILIGDSRKEVEIILADDKSPGAISVVFVSEISSAIEWKNIRNNLLDKLSIKFLNVVQTKHVTRGC